MLINNELATKKKKEAHTKPEKSLKEYLIARNNIAAIEQEKERVILKNQKQERARQKEIDLKSQISKSRISIFFSMNKVYFNHNSAILDNKAKDVLVKTAEFMLYYSDFKYNIMGHADKSYTEEQNTSLSQNRAITVKNFLVEQGGVDPSILFIIAKGSSEPIANNYSKRDKALNRRVTFSIVE